MIPRLERASVSMRALDEHPWTAGVAFTAFGVRIGVRVDDAALLPLVRERFPPHAEAGRDAMVDHVYSLRSGSGGAGGGPFYRVNADHELLVSTGDRDVALSALESGLRLGVAADAEKWVFVHAGAVGWNGRAIVIPAPSTHGKSTLVAALVRAGATYYSDEFTVLDGRGRVHPFAKPLSLRVPEGLPRRVPVAELGGEVGLAPLPIAVIAATAYQPDAVWDPREGTHAQAVLAMLSNAVSARRAPRRTMRVLTRAVAHAVLLEGPRHEAEPVAAALLEAADRQATARRWPLLGRLKSSR
jgi:hypothetical protein